MASETNPPAPANVNFVIQRGIDMPEMQFQLIGANKVPVDMTGYTIEAQARQQAEDENGVFFDLEPEFIDASEGTYKFPTKTAATTYALTDGEYHYDVVFISGTGVRIQPPQVGQIDVVSINTHLP